MNKLLYIYTGVIGLIGFVFSIIVFKTTEDDFQAGIILGASALIVILSIAKLIDDKQYKCTYKDPDKREDKE